MSLPQTTRKKNDLSEKELIFVAEYLIDLNATRAIHVADPTILNPTAAAKRILAKPIVQALIDKRRAEIRERTAITAEKVLEEYRRIAFFDPIQCFNSDGSMKDFEELDSTQRAAISSIKITENTITSKRTIEFRTHNKLTALEALSKHLGLFEKDNEQKRPDTVNINVLNQILNVLPAEQREQFKYDLIRRITGGEQKEIDVVRESSDEEVVDIESEDLDEVEMTEEDSE